jgi:hypothetical protein
VSFATAIDALTFAQAAEATFVFAPATLASSSACNCWIGSTVSSMYAGDSTRLAGSPTILPATDPTILWQPEKMLPLPYYSRGLLVQPGWVN